MMMNYTTEVWISFDFDGTLSLPSVQEFAKKLIKKGFNIKIVTTRLDKYLNQDLIRIKEKLGIDTVIYTNGEDKHYFMDGIDLHFDNDDREIRLINRYSKGTETINITDKEWNTIATDLIGKI
jgi:predicted ABC-type ATPase